MIPVIAIMSIVVFVAGLWVSGMARVAAGALATTRGAIAVMRDEDLTDEAREKAVQRASFQLLRAFRSMLVRGTAVLLASIFPVWAVSLAGLVEVEDVFQYLSRWNVIVTTSAVITVGYIVWMRRWACR